MPVDQALRERVRDYLKSIRGIEEKAMSGGIQFTWNGKMLCGVMEESLMLRLPKEEYEKFVAEGAKPVQMGGMSSKAYLLVHQSKLVRKPATKKWIDRSIDRIRSVSFQEVRKMVRVAGIEPATPAV